MAHDYPPYLRALLERVEDVTGASLLLSEEQAIGYDSEVRFASSTIRQHVVAYDPAYRDYQLHFAVNGAFKILRFWSTPPTERYMPGHTLGDRLPAADEREFREKFSWLPVPDFEALSRFLYHGIVRQITSMPLDIRVEQEIHERAPEHRGQQAAYLCRQVQDLELTFTRSVH